MPLDRVFQGVEMGFRTSGDGETWDAYRDRGLLCCLGLALSRRRLRLCLLCLAARLCTLHLGGPPSSQWDRRGRTGLLGRGVGGGLGVLGGLDGDLQLRLLRHHGGPASAVSRRLGAGTGEGLLRQGAFAYRIVDLEHTGTYDYKHT